MVQTPFDALSSRSFTSVTQAAPHSTRARALWGAAPLMLLRRRRGWHCSIGGAVVDVPDASEDGGARDAAAGGPSHAAYQVQVRVAQQLGAGTEAAVRLTLVGDRGSARMVLNRGGGGLWALLSGAADGDGLDEAGGAECATLEDGASLVGEVGAVVLAVDGDGDGGVSALENAIAGMLPDVSNLVLRRARAPGRGRVTQARVPGTQTRSLGPGVAADMGSAGARAFVLPASGNNSSEIAIEIEARKLECCAHSSPSLTLSLDIASLPSLFVGVNFTSLHFALLVSSAVLIPLPLVRVVVIVLKLIPKPDELVLRAHVDAQYAAFVLIL